MSESSTENQIEKQCESVPEIISGIAENSDRIADNSDKKDIPIENKKKDLPSNYASLSIDIGYNNLAVSIYMPNENNLLFGLSHIF